MGILNIDAVERDALLKMLVKQYGPGYSSFGADMARPKAIPTGHDDLDSVLTKGAHGIYLGGLVELCGSEGSGKSSVALRTVGYAQKLGHTCCWIDAEAAFDENVAILNGCDPTTLILPDLAESKVVASSDDNETKLSFFNSTEVLEMIYKSVCSRLFGLIVLDSVAGLMPDRILQDDFDANKVGVAEVARSMSQMLGKIAQACKKTETTVIFINQLRDKPGEYFQDRFHTPGGKALKFFAHQRISVEKIRSKEGKVISTDEDGNEELIGHYARVNIIKNRKAPPVQDGTVIEIPVYYKKYFPDDAKKCYDLARKLGVIKIRTGVLTWKDNDAIIARESGEAAMLLKIREGKLEKQLALSCVAVADGNPTIKIPSFIKDIIKDSTAEANKTTDDKTKPATKKSKKGPAIDLS